MLLPALMAAHALCGNPITDPNDFPITVWLQRTREAKAYADTPVAKMLKEYGGALYLFAINMRNQANSAEFTFCEMPGARLKGCTMEANDGFKDSSGAYEEHIYKITAK